MRARFLGVVFALALATLIGLALLWPGGAAAPLAGGFNTTSETAEQCMTTAAVAVGAVGGLRAWLAARQPAWLTPSRLRRATIVLLSSAILAAGLGVG